MKVAFCNRPNWDNPLGGDGIQMLKTKEKLEKNYDVKVNIVTDPGILDDTYDIIHIFNFATYNITNSFFEKAQEINRPVAASTIYWDYSYGCTYVLKRIFGYSDYLSENQLRIEKILIKLLYFWRTPKYTSFWFRKKVRKFISHSSVLLPNSREEADHLLKFAGLSNNSAVRAKIHVVYNGIDKESSPDKCISKEEFLKKYSIPNNYILQVGRIEYVKNQINLVYALRNHSEIPIVFVGKPVQEGYYRKLKELSNRRGNVFFINSVPHDEISLFYKFAEVHVLLSLRESPGLVTIEAAKEGCPIVVTTKAFSPVETYFSNCPYIVNPLDLNDIEETVLKAFNEKRKTMFDFDKFSWDCAAEQTYEAYLSICGL